MGSDFPATVCSLSLCSLMILVGESSPRQTASSLVPGRVFIVSQRGPLSLFDSPPQPLYNCTVPCTICRSVFQRLVPDSLSQEPGYRQGCGALCGTSNKLPGRVRRITSLSPSSLLSQKSPPLSLGLLGGGRGQGWGRLKVKSAPVSENVRISENEEVPNPQF